MPRRQQAQPPHYVLLSHAKQALEGRRDRRTVPVPIVCSDKATNPIEFASGPPGAIAFLDQKAPLKLATVHLEQKIILNGPLQGE